MEGGKINVLVGETNQCLQIVLANKSRCSSLHANGSINVKATSALSGGRIPCDVRFIGLSCFTRKQNDFMWG